MSIKRRLLVLCGLCLVIMLAIPALVGCAAQSTAPEAIKWRYHSHNSPGEPYEVYLKQYVFDEVATRSNGQFMIEPHYQSELGYASKEVLHVLGSGLLEMAAVHEGGITYEYPWVGVINLAYVLPKVEQQPALLEAVRPIYRELLEDNNCVLFGNGGAQDIYLTLFWGDKKPMTLADFKGLKVRTYSRESTSLMEMMGASPLFIELSEVYLAMQKGLVDGMYCGTGVENFEDRHYDEVTKYIMHLHPYLSTTWIGINHDALVALPHDMQNLLMECGRNYQEEWDKFMMAPDAYTNFVKACEERDIELYWAEDEFYEELRKMAAVQWEEWLQMNREFSPEAGRKAEENLNRALRAVEG